MSDTLHRILWTLGRMEASQEHFHHQHLRACSDMREMREVIREVRTEMQDVHRRVVRLESRGPRPPVAELLIKRGLTVLLPLLTLWATGSIDAALKVLSALK